MALLRSHARRKGIATRGNRARHRDERNYAVRRGRPRSPRAKGDAQAFASLVDHRLEPTFRIALAILGNEADARDATQEVFVRLWRNLPGLRDEHRFAAWFHRIVVNTCRSEVRGHQRRRVREIAVATIDESANATLGHDEQSASAELLTRAIDRLTPAERTLLALHHYEGLSLAEIGDLHALPVRTIKSRLFAARRSLERAIEVERR
jgi:RNA polymerase sigma-70 factor (ECF subfamily)